ncbi:MAG: sigma-E factor negative regulatory protein [Acidithiobacillus sp.]|nr:sigma-E factor negative regulatory protein [Acidithiobacillus sp.]
MNNETKSALMAFMDGELGALSARRMAVRLEREPALQAAWEEQYRVSYLLQRGQYDGVMASPGFVQRVADRIDQGEMVTKPGAKSHWWAWSSVAAVAIVTFSLLLGPHQGAKDVVALSQSPTGTQSFASNQHFFLRPVRFLSAPTHSAQTDLVIQREIRNIWRPVRPDVDFSEVQPGRGLLPVRYQQQAGIFPEATVYWHH